MRRFVTFAATILAVLSAGLVSVGASQASPTTSPIGRAAVQAGYRLLHALPAPPGATRVSSIPRGVLSVSGGSLDYAGPTETSDLKLFYRVSDGATLPAWIDVRHNSQLSSNSQGQWGQWGVTKGYDSIWNVDGSKYVMQVAYNVNAVASGSAYLRVDVFVFWSPEFDSLSATASRVTLLVTSEVVKGTVTVPASKADNFGKACVYKVYRDVTAPLETLSNPSRVANLERYVNSRTDWDYVPWFIGTLQTICDTKQLPPPSATYVLAFYRSGATKPFAAIDGTLATSPPGTSVIAWVRSPSGKLIAKSGLKGVSLSFLESYLR